MDSNFALTGLGAKNFISQIGEVAKIVADKYYAKINEIKELKYKLEKATAELEHIYTEEK